jgi:hypothetical protein
MKKNVLLLLICVLISFTTTAQIDSKPKRFKVGFEFGLTFSAITYQDMSFDPIYKNYFGQWVLPNLQTGTFSGVKPYFTIGVNTEWHITKKIALQNGFSFFVRNITHLPIDNTITYAGLTTMGKFLPFNKIPNLYFLAGGRLDYMFDYYRGQSRAILNYSEKEFELSPIVGIGYEWKNLPFITLTTDIRFNQGIKNLLAQVPWKDDNRFNSSAYNQTIWLNLNFWFKKKQKQ